MPNKEVVKVAREFLDKAVQNMLGVYADNASYEIKYYGRGGINDILLVEAVVNNKTHQFIRGSEFCEYSF